MIKIIRIMLITGFIVCLPLNGGQEDTVIRVEPAKTVQELQTELSNMKLAIVEYKVNPKYKRDVRFANITYAGSIIGSFILSSILFTFLCFQYKTTC